MKKLILTISLALAVSVSVAAVPLVYMALGASVALHTAFGLVYDYFLKPVTTPTQVIKVALQANNSVSEADISKQQGSLAQTKSANTLGPFSYTVTCPTTTCKRSSNYRISGDTIPEFLDNAATCPSDVCVYGNNVPLQFSYSWRDNYVSDSAKWTSSGVFRTIRWVSDTGVASTIDVPAEGGFSCPQGYTENYNTFKCDLTNIDLAHQGLGNSDGVCVVKAGAANINDDDCSFLAANGYLTSTTASDGSPVTAIADPRGDKSIITQKYDSASGGNIISQTKQSSDGGVLREDTLVEPNGTVNVTNITNYPGNPPPIYPGDSGGTVIPGSGGTSQTFDMNGIKSELSSIKSGQCGGPGQPACKVTFDTESVGDGPDIPSALPDELTSITDGIVGQANISVSPACPANLFSFELPLPASAGGPVMLSDNGAFCSAMDLYAPLIRALSIAAAMVSATFIVLRA